MDDNKFGTDAHKLVRNSDPGTSVEAACSVNTTRLEQIVYTVIGSFGLTGATSDEICEQLPQFTMPTITPRFKPLLDKGFIEAIGKRPGRSGRNQRVVRVKK